MFKKNQKKQKIILQIIILIILNIQTFSQQVKEDCQQNMQQTKQLKNFVKVPASSLFVSEPEASWFGNPPNPKNNPLWTNKNWLKSRFHFAFAENYNGPREFGVLRVMNDDLVQPDRGFGTHPHRNMEICTYIVQGTLTHQDSMGTKQSLGRSGIQYMSAGTGVQHSEFNNSKDKDLRFIQIWINTRQANLKPKYGQFDGDEKIIENQFQHLVKDVQDTKSQAKISINQDANIFVANTSIPLNFQVKDGRQAYILQMEGDSIVEINGSQINLDQQDAAKVQQETQIKFIPQNKNNIKSHILIVEMKYSFN